MRSLFGHEGLLGQVLARLDCRLVIKAILIAFFIYAVLLSLASFLAVNPFTDNQYNHGLVARSALVSGPSLLETSYRHWYFGDEDLVRAEDWHRSTYLLVLTGLHQLCGGFAQECTKVLYALIVVAVFSLILTLSIRANHQPKPGCISASSFLFAGLLLPILMVNNWASGLLAADFLDDMPAALCSLAAATLLTLRGTSVLNCVLIGLLAALAFSVKNLSLVLFPVFWMCITLILMLEERDRKILRWVRESGAYLTGYLVLLIPVLYWNKRELGLFLPEQARLGLIGRLRTDTPNGEHELYFLKPELERAESWLRLLLEKGLISELWDGWLTTMEALKSGWVILLVATLGLLGTWLARRRHSVSPAYCRLGVVFAISLLGFTAFFTLKLGEAGQLRYWLLPFGLGAALGISGLLVFYRSFTLRECLASCASALKLTGPSLTSSAPKQSTEQGIGDPDRLARCLMAALLLTLVLNTVGQSARPAAKLWWEPYGYPDETTQRLSEIADSNAIMVHSNVGVNYWIDQPLASLAGLQPAILITLTVDQLARFVERYDVKAAVFRDWRRVGRRDPYKVVDFLKENGFCEDSATEGFVILVWQGVGHRGQDCGPNG